MKVRDKDRRNVDKGRPHSDLSHGGQLSIPIHALFIILVFLAVLQNSGESHIIEVTLRDRGTHVHLINLERERERKDWDHSFTMPKPPHLFISKSISHCGQQLSQTIFIDVTWKSNLSNTATDAQKERRTSVFRVKASKGVPDDILWVSSIQLLAEHREKHCEVDGTRWAFHHLFQILIWWVFTCRKARGN